MNRHQRRAAAAKLGVQAASGAAASLQFGIAHHHAGLLAEAERCYRQVLSYEPEHSDALHLIGCVYMQTERAEQGIAAVQRAIALNPANAEYHSNLAAGFSRLHRYEEAAEAYGRSVDLSATSGMVFNDFGKVLEKLGRTAPALAAFAQGVQVDPMMAELYLNLGRMLQKFERYDDAFVSMECAVALAPDNAEAFCHRSTLLYAMKRFDEALTSAERAVALKPGWAEPHNIRGSALHRMGDLAGSLASFDRALSLDPTGPEVHLNRSSSLVDLHRFEEAAAAIDEAIRLKPDYAEAHNNLGLLSLLIGDFARGWAETEWRWKCPSLKLKEVDFSQPLWLGEKPLEGRTILLHNDQGLGDAINFVRYAPLVAARGGRVVLAVDPPLVDILQSVEGVALCVNKEQAPLPDFDLHCPLSSLPLAFATDLDTIPAEVPYVRRQVTDKWQARLGAKRAPRIGLVWSGNPNHGNDHNRSLKFRQLEPLLDLPFDFYSLQKDVRACDVDALAMCPRITPLGQEITTFADTTALLGELDLLITVDTSIAHIAGAIAMPTYVMLPHTPDWRWLLDRNDSPWYPTLRLFRQNEKRDYTSVIDDMRAALMEMFEAAQ